MNDITKILVPVDFSENSQKILKSAHTLAKKLKAAITVVYVMQTFEDYSGFFVPHLPLAQFEEEMLKSAEGKMESFIDEHTEPGEAIETKVLSGDVAEEIINFADKNSMDMIVMGTHGYRGFEKALFGSIAEKVVKTAPCPVLVVNPYK